MKRDYFEGADVAVTICAKDGTSWRTRARMSTPSRKKASRS